MTNPNGPSARSSSASSVAPPPVLIADDDERNLYSLRNMLAGLDVEIVCEPSGSGVLRSVLYRDFAAILLDVRMPEMDGYETATLIHRREKSQHIPIIFLTALDKEITNVFRGYDAGAVDYVFKPVNPFILRSKVSVFIDLYNKAEKIRRQVARTRELLKENIRARRTNEAYLERLQNLSRQLMTLQDDERRNLARELHDEIGQCLTALKLNLQMLTKYPRPSGSNDHLVNDSIEIINSLVGQVRDMSLKMHPTMLEDFGLESALHWYLDHIRERSELIIERKFELGDVPLTREQTTACYRIVQSAITNVVRHAEATRVEVSLRTTKGKEVILTVSDDGVGFDQRRISRVIQQGKSFGLTAMRERVSLIGGTIEFDSKRGHGTVVRLQLPLSVDARPPSLMRA